MSGALLYLTACSVRNRARRQLRRLREPRYVAALLLGLVYLWFVFFGGPEAEPPPIPAESVRLAGSVLLALAVGWSWVFGAHHRALAFTAAEVAFLFPAPLGRPALVHYKLLRAQLAILIGTVIWSVLLAGERQGAPLPLRAVALWVLFATLTLHRMGAALVRTGLAEHGAFGWRRRRMTLVLAAVLAVLGFAAAAQVVSAAVAAWPSGIRSVAGALAAALDRPLPALVLAPFRAMLRPLSEPTPAGWLRAMPLPVLLLGLHYAWVVRSEAAFEEAAADAALERARRIGQGRSGRPRTARPLPRWLRLAPAGAPGRAILWKNLVMAVRSPRARTAFVAGAAAAAVTIVAAFSPGDSLPDLVGTLGALWALIFVGVGPQWIRNDLRTDLPRLELLRSYPLSGRAVVLAEAAASALVMTLVHFALLGVAAVGWAAAGGAAASPLRLQALAVAIIVLPAVNLAGTVLHNGAAVLFPGWIRLGPERPGGVEALGQTVLVMTGYLVALLLLLLAPALAGGGLFLLLRGVLGAAAPFPAAAGAALVLGLETLGLAGRFGRAFERLEPSAIV